MNFVKIFIEKLNFIFLNNKDKNKKNMDIWIKSIIINFY